MVYVHFHKLNCPRDFSDKLLFSGAGNMLPTMVPHLIKTTNFFNGIPSQHKL